MSVTFYLKSKETAYPPCPACGGRINWEPKPDQDCQHPECEGYGPSMIESTPSLNLTNENFATYMRDVLGYMGKDPWCDALDPQDVLLRLAMASHKAPQAVRAPRSEGNCHFGGLPLERIHSYCERLELIAKLAIRRKEDICYG